MTSKDESKSSDLSEDYLYLKNIFDNDLAEVLLEQDYNDPAINLTEDKKFLYMFLYNLFQKKLTELRYYLNDVLIKK